MSHKAAKINLRKKILQQRKSLHADQIATASKNVAEHFCRSSCFLTSNHIACYMAALGEIDPRYIVQAIWQANKKCFLPILHPEKKNELLFQLYQEEDVLRKNSYQILEPILDHKKLITPENLDIVLLPLVAFDQNCNRLGMGAGYYDRTFAFHQNKNQTPLLIGLGYDFQQIDHIPHDSWDIQLNQILTESGFMVY